MYRSFLSLLVLILPLTLFAQTWEWEADVESPARSGFHDMDLPPTLTAHLNPEFGNLRLYDDTGETVPYLMFSEVKSEQEVRLRWYRRIREDDWRRHYSRSYFEHPRAETIDRMVLKIRNADVTQHFWLSGSDDMAHWYIVKDDYSYAASWDPGNSYNLMTIHFPPVNYRYYKVEIRHRWREPIQIMGAGYYAAKEKAGRLQKVPEPALTQTESGQKSVVDIRFDGAHYFDRLFFEVDGPEMYHRGAVLSKAVRGGDGRTRYETLREFTLSSKTVAQLEFESERATALRLTIDNKDDRPLRIAAAPAHTRRKYLTARLEKGRTYALKIGPEHLRSPDYDLAHFTDDLPRRRPALAVSAPQKIPAAFEEPAASKAKESAKNPTSQNPRTYAEPKPQTEAGRASKTETTPLLQHKAFLWIGIVVIVLLLGFMSFRMLRDMNA
ncbi:MAG: hypothetical protein AAF570_03330 [Bacteroidota bacterium]